MKKCPKCGTILDDSKKKCYMCGADLQKTTITNFGDSFDSQIGATVTKSQDNVFNNVNNISAQVGDVVNKSDNNATFTQNSSSADFYKSQLNGLNSMQYDERTALEKIFSGDSRFRSKDEINAQAAMQENIASNKDYSNNVNNSSSNPNTEFNNGFTGLNNGSNNTNSTNSTKVEQKPQINWGNNLVSNNNDISGYKDKVGKKFKINISFVVNTLCFLLFLFALLYIYFNYIRVKTESNVSLGGLNYTIDENFVLKSDSTYSMYYVYGDNCGVRISYGPTNDVDGFVDSYFDSIENEYANNDDYVSVTETMTINDNLWHALSIMSFEESAASSTGYTQVLKYKYISMIYNGNFYTIIFANSNNDNTCSAMYNSLVDTLSFD